MNGLDLFSGIGGLTVALSEWVNPVAYCENDRYAQAVLLQRMAKGDVPTAPIWDDVTTLRGDMLPSVDIIYGGFPCQDISTVGSGDGLEGKQSGLFFEIMRLAEETRPTFIFLENVPAIRTRGLDVVGKQLADHGYDCRWGSLSAYDVGAPHKRERWFLLAYAKGERFNAGLEVCKQARKPNPPKFNRWETEPSLVRVADGVPHRVDRIRGLGNAVVPLQVRTAFVRLIGLEGA